MVTREQTTAAVTVGVPAGTVIYEMLDDMGGAVLTVIVHRPCREVLISDHLFQLEDQLGTSAQEPSAGLQLVR